MKTRRGRLLLIADAVGVAGLYSFVGFLILAVFTCEWHTCGNHVPPWGWQALLLTLSLGGMYLLVLLGFHAVEPRRKSRGLICGYRTRRLPIPPTARDGSVRRVPTPCAQPRHPWAP